MSETNASMSEPSAVASSTKPETNSRREMVTRLLGIAAGGAALQALAGCLPGSESESDDEALAEVADGIAASGQSIVWAETIGTAPNTGNLRGQPGGATDNRIAIVEGCLAKGDGGGGMFYWDPTVVADDGGTVIVAYVGTDPVGVWRRIYSGPVNVRWFGVEPGTSYADAAIQKAIAVAKTDPYRTKPVYQPAGRYVVASSVLLPRLAGDYNGAFTFFGDGPDKTTLECLSSLAPQHPVIGFEYTSDDIHDVTIKGMTVVHGNKGFGIAVFSNGSQRAERLLLEDLQVNTHNNAPGGLGQYSPIYLHNVYSSRLDRIRAWGGESVLFLRACARVTVVDFITGADRTYMTGIRISGAGGSHHFIKTRIEGAGTADAAGTGVIIHAEGLAVPEHILFESLSFEGESTGTQIHIPAGRHITFLRCHMADSLVPDARGIVFGSGAHHIRFLGGWIYFMYDPATPNRRAVSIEADASDIFFDASMKSSGDPDLDLEVASGARRVRMRMVLEKGEYYEYNKVAGVVSELKPKTVGALAGVYYTQAYDISGGDVFRVPSGANVSTLLNGYEGQTITIIADTGGTIQPGGNIKLSVSAGPFAPAATEYATLTLLCYRSGDPGYDPANPAQGSSPCFWREVSRSING